MTQELEILAELQRLFEKRQDIRHYLTKYPKNRIYQESLRAVQVDIQEKMAELRKVERVEAGKVGV